MTAVQLRGLSYRHASRAHDAFADVDLTVEPGETILLTGDSGAGKSTLLAAIAGVLGDEEDGHLRGEVTVAGTVGMVLQDPDSQVIASRVGDDVAFGAENLAVAPATIWDRVHRALDLVGLNLPLDYPTARLSGGQKQRLALAGIIAMGADIILLDEPTANLDPAGRVDVVAAVADLARRTNTAIIIAEHRPHHWLPLHPTIYHLDGHLTQIPELPPLPEVAPARPIDPATLTRQTAAVWCENLQPPRGPARTLGIPTGASTVLTGPNGVGKSTLAATMGGLLTPRGGVLEYAPDIRAGLAGPAYRWRSSELAARIGFVFQDPEHHFAFRTVADELAATQASQQRREELAERLRLTHVLQANPFTLSGGEKRRLSVATALLAAPSLVILDEPTFGQDDAGLVELLRLIRDINDAGHTVVSITHDELFVRALGDYEVALR